MTVRSAGHTVLASADSDVYASLRKRPSSRAERYAMGRALRREVPRKSLAAWRVAADRPDPVQLIMESHEGRLDWLIPVRVARMVISPYGFLRGTAIVMFAHTGWREAVPFMNHCSTKWATFLMSLKQLVETGSGQPAPHDVQVSNWH